MRRPGLYVRQNENGTGDFWWVVKSPNGHILATSEMYTTRAHAKRAARSFIKLVDPVSVEFSYWVGLVPSTIQARRFSGSYEYRLETERIR